MAVTTFIVRRVDENDYSLEMACELGSLSVHVSVPQGLRDLKYTEDQRMKLAHLSAQQVAIEFVEKVLDDLERRSLH